MTIIWMTFCIWTMIREFTYKRVRLKIVITMSLDRVMFPELSLVMF